MVLKGDGVFIDRFEIMDGIVSVEAKSAQESLSMRMNLLSGRVHRD